MKKDLKLKHTIAIDIYSDTICPWCYIAKRKLQSAIEELPDYRFDILWHPYQLNPDMPLEGMNRGDYLNKNQNLNKENLDYNKDYSVEEYEKILEGYNDRTDFPNIN